MRALRDLAAVLEAHRDFPAALIHAQRLRDCDPLREDSQMLVSRLLALNNDRAGALRVFHEYAALLKRELGAEPGAAMREIHERLRRGEDQGDSAAGVSAAFDIVAPLIGRQREWERLQAAWQRAAAGRAQVVLISGEAGIGKSRLAEELMVWAGRQGIRYSRSRAYAAEGGLAYAPVTEWLRSEALQAGVRSLDDVWLSEVVRLLPELSLERPSLPPPAPISDASQRQRF